MRSGKVRGEGTSIPESEAANNRAIEESKAKAKKTNIEDEEDLKMVAVLHELNLSIVETRGEGQCFFDAVAKELSLGNIDGIPAIETTH